MKKLFKNKYVVYLSILAAGLALGWLMFGGDNENAVNSKEETALASHEHEENTVWTCSMHPQVRQEEPGSCPICGMDLIPLKSMEGEAIDDNAIQMTEAAMKIADVQTVMVKRSSPAKQVYLPGKVKADERRISEITARFPGRIEKLYVNFTGQKVYKGQKLATVYSPSLVTAQKELFEAMKFKETNPSFYNSAVNKLKLWDLTEEQISSIENGGEVRYNFDVLATGTGTVLSRNVSLGDYIKEGQSLFEISNLGKVWVMFDAYESDLAWIREGDKIDFTIESVPGRKFTSTVTFIDPVINPSTRVALVRTEISNPDDLLKPEMFAKGILNAKLPGVENALVIPKTAVLWTGKRAVVYVKQPDTEQPAFKFRDIELGPEAGDLYVVNEGLEEGEEIVSNGVFKVDAAAQLQGKLSMMNPDGGKTSTGHNHGDMEMDSNDPEHKAMTKNSASPVKVDQKFIDQVKTTVSSYLEIKEALVNSDEAASKVAAKKFGQELGKVDMTVLSGDAHMAWMNFLKTLKAEIEKIGSSDLDGQRKAFGTLSDSYYHALKKFNINGLNIYYQFCPMANNNAGGFWLSETEEVRNPYFGESMLGCGETREKI